jgi:hypothetical protein
MSSIVILKQPGAIYTLTDGASWTADGIVTAIGPKTAVLPDINMAIFTQGPATLAWLGLYTFVDQFASFDHFVGEAAAHVRKLYFDHESLMREGGNPDAVFYFFGYSDRRSQIEGYVIHCSYDREGFYRDQKISVRGWSGRSKDVKIKPFVAYPITGNLTVAPGIFSKADLDAANFPTHLKPAELVPEIDMLHVFEMLRRTPCARFANEPKRINVGGHALLTRIDADGVTQTILAEYDDPIGWPIQEAPPLDWAKWRAERREERE